MFPSPIAHVDYVAEGDGPAMTIVQLLQHVLADPLNLGLLTVGGVGILLAMYTYIRVAHNIPDINVLRRTMMSYRPYLPWLLRISLGFPLVGAGFSGYMFSPSVGISARLLLVPLGFLLLFGLGVRIVAAIGLLTYIWAVVQDPSALLAFEFFGGFIAIMLLGSGQPSADFALRRLIITDGTYLSRLRPIHGLAEQWLEQIGATRDFGAVAIRVTLGMTFIGLGITQKWLAPSAALTVVDKYGLTGVVPVSPEMWVFSAGLLEVFLGALLIVGMFTRGAAGAAFFVFTLSLFGLPDDPVLAHLSLFGLASALLITGAGPYSVDNNILPALRTRIRGLQQNSQLDDASPSDD